MPPEAFNHFVSSQVRSLEIATVHLGRYLQGADLGTDKVVERLWRHTDRVGRWRVELGASYVSLVQQKLYLLGRL